MHGTVNHSFVCNTPSGGKTNRDKLLTTLALLLNRASHKKQAAFNSCEPNITIVFDRIRRLVSVGR